MEESLEAEAICNTAIVRSKETIEKGDSGVNCAPGTRHEFPRGYSEECGVRRLLSIVASIARIVACNVM
jgi:hypothetical protein